MHMPATSKPIKLNARYWRAAINSQSTHLGRTLMLSPQVLRELADYIEWMQQRIALLEGKRCDAPAN